MCVPGRDSKTATHRAERREGKRECAATDAAATDAAVISADVSQTALVPQASRAREFGANLPESESEGAPSQAKGRGNIEQ